MDLDYDQIKETILKIQIETRSHKLTKLSILLHQITKKRDFNVSIIFQLKKNHSLENQMETRSRQLYMLQNTKQD